MSVDVAPVVDTERPPAPRRSLLVRLDEWHEPGHVTEGLTDERALKALMQLLRCRCRAHVDGRGGIS